MGHPEEVDASLILLLLVVLLLRCSGLEAGSADLVICGTVLAC